MAQENKPARAADAVLEEESLGDETEVSSRPGWREVFRHAFDQARREQLVTNRRDLGRDRSRSLILLGGAAIAVLLLFLGVFSSSNTAKKTADRRQPGAPDLGRRETPGQRVPGQTGSVTPLLNAQTGRQIAQGTQDVTPEDVGRTARPAVPPANARSGVHLGPHALGNIDFSDPAARQKTARAPASPASDDLKKPSLVFVRSMQSSVANAKTESPSVALEESRMALDLPAGTRLVARLESVVSSAIKAPVVAAIEYNYERDGEIIIPAGAKALGSLQQADRSGNVAIRFDTLQMPDGGAEKIEAAAMSLTYGPVRGNVSGKKTGTRFLVRALTGLGTVAAYLVGAGGGTGFNGPLSESALLRDRVATNIGTASDQELNSLAFNQNLVVTVPGNTRFYIVVENGSASRGEEARPVLATRASNTQLPNLTELRQLMQLRRELSEMVQEGSAANAAQPVPQQ